jgi:hypothetical protein
VSLLTPGAEGTKHLQPGTVAAAPTVRTSRLVGTAACGAPLGLIAKAFRFEELLLPGAKGKGSATIGTSDGLVVKTHWMTSSSRNFS